MTLNQDFTRYRVNTGRWETDIDSDIYLWISNLHQFAHGRTLDQYDITTLLPRFCVTSQISICYSVQTSQNWVSKGLPCQQRRNERSMIVVIGYVCLEYRYSVRNKITYGLTWPTILITREAIRNIFGVSPLVTQQSVNHTKPYIILFLFYWPKHQRSINTSFMTIKYFLFELA